MESDARSARCTSDIIALRYAALPFRTGPASCSSAEKELRDLMHPDERTWDAEPRGAEAGTLVRNWGSTRNVAAARQPAKLTKA